MINIMNIAKVCHEVNRAFCLSIGDTSQKSWESSPEWQQKSAMDGVMYLVANPNSTPADIHNNWISDKEKAGWVYGDKKDEVKKTHPCLVPYDKLSVEQRTKDHLFNAVVATLRTL